MESKCNGINASGIPCLKRQNNCFDNKAMQYCLHDYIGKAKRVENANGWSWMAQSCDGASIYFHQMNTREISIYTKPLKSIAKMRTQDMKFSKQSHFNKINNALIQFTTINFNRFEMISMVRHAFCIVFSF